jgi:putative flavoprotein involved in K+ transport
MLDKAPNGKVSDLLNAVDNAMSAGDVEHAVDLFQTDCYWRDLVTFTWNIKTMEGREQVRDMLKARLADTKPSNWKIAEGEDASEADGIIESWIQFETGVARGFGHIRVKDGRIWTLLTTMSELKGHEEAVGFDRPMGAKHGAERNRKTWKEDREAEAAELGYSRQPYCLIIGGGQGGIALGSRLRSSSRKTRGRATVGASVISHSACTIQFGMTICPTCPFHGTGPSSHRRTKSEIGSKCIQR